MEHFCSTNPVSLIQGGELATLLSESKLKIYEVKSSIFGFQNGAKCKKQFNFEGGGY